MKLISSTAGIWNRFLWAQQLVCRSKRVPWLSGCLPCPAHRIRELDPMRCEDPPRLPWWRHHWSNGGMLGAIDWNKSLFRSLNSMALRWGSKAAFYLSDIHGNGYCSKRCVGKRRKGFGLRGEEDQGLETQGSRGTFFGNAAVDFKAEALLDGNCLRLWALSKAMSNAWVKFARQLFYNPNISMCVKSFGG